MGANGTQIRAITKNLWPAEVEPKNRTKRPDRPTGSVSRSVGTRDSTDLTPRSVGGSVDDSQEGRKIAPTDPQGRSDKVGRRQPNRPEKET